jgi:hypothetical protein
VSPARGLFPYEGTPSQLKLGIPNCDFCPVDCGTFNSFVLRFLRSCDLKPQPKRKDATNITTHGQLYSRPVLGNFSARNLITTPTTIEIYRDFYQSLLAEDKFKNKHYWFNPNFCPNIISRSKSTLRISKKKKQLKFCSKLGLLNMTVIWPSMLTIIAYRHNCRPHCVIFSMIISRTKTGSANTQTDLWNRL